MAENFGSNEFSNQSNLSESYSDYLARAAGACEAGDLVLGMHLYLAAYERAVSDPEIADGMALAGLREAWNLACDLKERSMAEYVFEKLEPYLTGEEIAHCANKLQDLALDRLEEYGFSREDLQDMAEMISQDLIDGEGSIVKVESISIPHVMGVSAEDVNESIVAQAADEVFDEAQDNGQDNAQESTPHPRSNSKAPSMSFAAPDFNPYAEFETSSVGTSFHAATNEGAGSYVFTRDKDRAVQGEAAQELAAQASAAQEQAGNFEAASTKDVKGARVAKVEKTEKAEKAVDFAATKSGSLTAASVPIAPSRPKRAAGASELPAMPEVEQAKPATVSYRTLAGYDEAVAAMRDLGVGLQRDGGFRNFIDMMNARHGLDRMPALDTLLFRSPVVEDATRFVDATIGELGLPVLRMSMEESFQGAPMLCVTTFGNARPRMNHAHNRFDGPGILVIDDLDMWIMPQMPEGVEGIAGFVMANMSRGAREAVNLIRSAVEDPEVYVLATATTAGEIDPFFYDLLEPITVVDIALPTDVERGEIWAEIMRDHPSMRTLNRADLVRLSDGLPRYDIYMAARAAVEEAYKTGLIERMFVPVTPQNIFDKLAACQPLDSDEYRAIEDEVIRNFRADLEHLEDLID